MTESIDHDEPRVPASDGTLPRDSGLIPAERLATVNALVQARCVCRRHALDPWTACAWAGTMARNGRAADH